MAETRILEEMTIKKYFPWVKNRQAYFFSLKIKIMDLWMQIEGRKLILNMNFSVQDFFKFASRMPQIAQILVSTLKIFHGGMPLNPCKYSPCLFFFSNSRLWLKQITTENNPWFGFLDLLILTFQQFKIWTCLQHSQKCILLKLYYFELLLVKVYYNVIPAFLWNFF